MRQTAAGSSTVALGRTLAHNHRNPQIPLPPGLPRFSLHDERASDTSDELDSLDVASTAQRPTVRPGRAPHVRKKIAADATAEVQVEDILLEVYAEEPPPPLTRRSPGTSARAPSHAALDALSESGEARDSIAMAIASIVPPRPAQSAAVDALLRASDPAFAPFSGHMHAYGARAQTPSAEYETPSVGPMMMATTPPPAPAIRAKRRGAGLAIWASAITLLAVVAGGVMMIALRDDTYAHSYARLYARLRDSAKTALHSSPKHDAPAAAAATAAPAPAPIATVATVATVTSPAAAVPSAVPTISVDALPKPAVAADSSLVTFPPYAEGHRVFLDGRVLPVVMGRPTAIKCGRHMLKIGSTRRARVVDFACGREVIVQ